MKKKKTGVVLIAVFVFVAAAFLSLVFIARHELRAVSTVKKVDSYGFYTMHYTTDYGFDEFLKTGASNDQEMLDFIVRRLFRGLPVKIDISDMACTTFNCETGDGDHLFGRNFDWGYSPSMLVRTQPENGYKSISMVNLGFLSYDKTFLPDKYINRYLCLAAPYVPLDGINDKGHSIGVLQLMDEPVNQQTSKIDLTTTAMIRLVLDKAATVGEAVELFEKYDMHDSVGSAYHYQIADASGASVVIEYVDNELRTIVPEKRTNCGEGYQAAANFYLSAGVDDPDGFGRDRVATVTKKLHETGGILSRKDAMKLLGSASIKEYVWPDGWVDKTQWSAVYDLTNLEADICVGMNYDQVYTFKLPD